MLFQIWELEIAGLMIVNHLLEYLINLRIASASSLSSTNWCQDSYCLMLYDTWQENRHKDDQNVLFWGSTQQLHNLEINLAVQKFLIVVILASARCFSIIRAPNRHHDL